jgi:hypothetical protein
MVATGVAVAGGTLAKWLVDTKNAFLLVCSVVPTIIDYVIAIFNTGVSRNRDPDRNRDSNDSGAGWL